MSISKTEGYVRNDIIYHRLVGCTITKTHIICDGKTFSFSEYLYISNYPTV